MPLTRLFSSCQSSTGTTFSRVRSETPIFRLVLAVLAVLLVSGLVTWNNLDKSKAFLQKVLAEKGKVLLLALEGGVRSGKRTASGLRFQYFLEELADRDAVRFIAITMPDGTIIAHTNPNRVGEVMQVNGSDLSAEDIALLAPTDQTNWAELNMEGGPAFVIYREFHPRDIRPPKGKDKLQMPTPYVFLGLDIRHIEQARLMDQRKALFYGGSVMVFGLLLVTSVYAWGRVQVSRRSQREAEALVEELALNLPDGLILFDSRGRIVRMNESAQRLLGEDCSAEAMRLPEPLRNLVEALLREPTLEDTPVTLKPGDHPLYLSVRGGHVGDAERRLGSLMLLRDVSDVRRLEAEVRRREKMAAVGNLAAGVAHELRNPLSSIKGYATYFSERFPEGSDEREAAKVMVRETDRLNRTITDLIGLARPTDIRVQSTDLATLLSDVVRLMRADAEARNVGITLTYEPDMPPVPLDPDRVRQVLLNLCINALDAMPEGGQLRLRLLRNPRQNSGVVVEVEDTGHGIKPDDLAHIFDPYFTTKGHGTGLGLATVHKIMEAHGGSVAVTSTPGEGAVFRIYFDGELVEGFRR